MTIEIRDAALEARLQKQLKSTGARSVEELLLQLLETQEEQDRWLSDNREAINAKIRHGIEQLCSTAVKEYLTASLRLA